METRCRSLHGTRTCLNLHICPRGGDWKKTKAVTAGLGNVISLKEFSSTGLLFFSISKEYNKTQDEM